MPYRVIHPAMARPNEELVDALAKELASTPDTSPSPIADLLLADTAIPDIQEEITHRNVRHVRTIWDRRSNISPAQRGEIIVEAYKKAQGEDFAHRISIAMGLTTPEAKRLDFAH